MSRKTSFPPAALLLLALTVHSTALAQPTEIKGAYQVASPWLLRPDDAAAWWKATFYNPTGIVVDDNGTKKLVLIVQALDNLGVPDTGAYDRCWGDQILLMEREWEFLFQEDEDASVVNEHEFNIVKRISPCPCEDEKTCPEEDAYVWGTGSVLRSNSDSNYYLFVDKAKPGVAIENGDFEEILVYTSPDAYDWESTPPWTLIRQSNAQANDGLREYSIVDMTLIAEDNRWWGTFRWFSRLVNPPDMDPDGKYANGLLQVFPDSSTTSGFRAEVLTTTQGWEVVGQDGSFTQPLRNIGASANSILKTEDGYELWREKIVNDTDAEPSCDDGLPAAKAAALGYHFITEEKLLQEDFDFGDFILAPSDIRANPNMSQSGYILPFVLDDDGDRVLFSSTSDNVCGVSGWPPSHPSLPDGNPFVGLDVVLSYMSEAYLTDRFRTISWKRPGTYPLDGTLVDLSRDPQPNSDEFKWIADASLVTQNGYATNNGGKASPAAGIPFNTATFSENLFTVEADVTVEGSEWVGIGFSADPTLSYVNQGQIWAYISSTGKWVLRIDDPVTPKVAEGLIADFDPTISYRLRVGYNKAQGVISVKAGNAGITAELPGGFVPNNQYVGFQLKTSSGATKLDNFKVILNEGPDGTILIDGFESGDLSNWQIGS